jgi:voltage-gated potassium channel
LTVRSAVDTSTVIREELRQVTTWGERHRRLIARLSVVAILTLVVDAIGTVLVYFAERDATHSEITSFGDALFFTTVQLLTISSQLRNPFTTWGRILDVGLEVWGVLVVAGSTGAVAAFFLQADE